MNALFRFQEVVKIINNYYIAVVDATIDMQMVVFKENKKKDCNAIFLIHQSIEEGNFNKIYASTITKQTWDILEKCYASGDKVKKANFNL